MNQFESLLPGLTPTMILGPQIDHHKGRLDLTPNDPFQDPVKRENFPLTEDKIIKINERMVEWDRILRKYQHDIYYADAKLDGPRSELETAKWTRQIIFELFPEIKKIVDHDHEDDFFNKKTVEDYINNVAINNAFRFRQSLIDFLPEGERTIIPSYSDIFKKKKKKKIPSVQEGLILNFRQSLSLSKDFQNIENLPDLIKLYPGNRPIFQNEQSGQSDQHQNKLSHEVMTLLSALYVTSVLDLSKAAEENILPDFVDDLDNAFPYKPPGLIYLLIGLSKDGICRRMSVHPNLIQAQLNKAIGRYDAADVHIIRNIAAEIDVGTRRLWEDLTEEEKKAGRKKTVKFFTIHDDREKTLESETCKAYRDRAMPPADRRGARIIIDDKNNLDIYLQLLRKKMVDWDFSEEEIKSKSRQQTIDDNVLYFAARYDNPQHKIEVNIEWLKEGSLGFGSWVQKRYESFAGRNAYAYKMRELIEEIYPDWFPEEIYGIRWGMDGIKNNLVSYANEKALG